MSDALKLQQLMAVCEARYAITQQAFGKLVAEENHLRAELARLDQMGHDAQPDGLDQMHLQAIGADLIWQGWLGRNKSSLNIALAQVLAQKEHHLSDVRQAYGKVLVVKELLAKLKHDVHKKRTQAKLDLAIDMSLLSRT